MTTNVLVALQSPESVRYFSDALMSDAELHLAATVASGRAARALLDAQTPDVMLIDLHLPDIDGIEVIRHAAQLHPACLSLVVATSDDEPRLKAAIDAGAIGFLLHDTSATDIANAVHELRAGGSPISPRIARQLLARLRGEASAAPIVVPLATDASSPLSKREREILRLTAKGLGFGTIGDLLRISPHTVETHAKRIYRKLAVHSRGEAVYEAYQMGWL